MLTDDEILDLVRECDLDWHAGWAGDGEDNRYARLARAVERAAAERMRERCQAACQALADELPTFDGELSNDDTFRAEALYTAHEAIAAIKIEGETR
jgi:hypothetical protein